MNKQKFVEMVNFLHITCGVPQGSVLSPNGLVLFQYVKYIFDAPKMETFVLHGYNTNISLFWTKYMTDFRGCFNKIDGLI